MARRNNKTAFKIITDRLRLIFGLLKNKFSHQAEDDLQRAEEQRRGRNEPPGRVRL